MSFEKAEELVRRLPRVVSCRIHRRESGALHEVVVAARPGSTASEVVVDVVTVLGTQALLDIDEEQVHVVVLPEGCQISMLDEPDQEKVEYAYIFGECEKCGKLNLMVAEEGLVAVESEERDMGIDVTYVSEQVRVM